MTSSNRRQGGSVAAMLLSPALALGLALSLTMGLSVSHAADPNTEETPPGRVPPGQPSSSSQLPGERPVMAQPEEERRPERDYGAILAAFSDAYSGQGQPRIAVYLNRNLSADVMEWRPQSRIVTEGKSRAGVRGSGDGSWKGGEHGDGEAEYEAEADADASGAVSTSTQTYRGPSGARVSPEETWMWEFEDGFMIPFLDAGAKLVDRAVVMRRVAAEDVRDRGVSATLSANTIETEALDGYADILLEILIRGSRRAPLGYEFRVTAKDVRTGEILAMVRDDGSNQEGETRREARATNRGYQIEEVTELRPVDEVSEDLALDTMEALRRRW